MACQCLVCVISHIVLQVSVQCQEDQHVLHGLIDQLNHLIQPLVEEDSEDEWIHEDFLIMYIT